MGHVVTTDHDDRFLVWQFGEEYGKESLQFAELREGQAGPKHAACKCREIL